MNNLAMHNSGRNVPAGAMDVWNQQQMPTQLGMPSPMQTPQPAGSPVQAVQKLLRGRVALAIVLALIGGIIGGALGFMSQAPTYQAAGQIQISPIVRLLDTDKGMPFFQQFLNTESLRITSPAILSQVPKYEPWKSVVGDNKEALADLGGNIKTQVTRNFNVIGIQYQNENQKVASAGVQSVIKAYAAQFKTSTDSNAKVRIDELTKRKAALDADVKAANDAIVALTATYGSVDLGSQVSSAQTRVEKIENEVRGHKNSLKAVNDAIKARNGKEGKIPLNDLAAIDDGLAKLISDLRQQQTEYERDKKILGPNHRKVQQEKVTIDVTAGGIDIVADAMRKDILAIIPDFVEGGNKKIKVTPSDLTLLETRVATLTDELTEAKKYRDTINGDAGKVAMQNNIIADAKKKLEDNTAALTDQEFRAASTGTLEVMQPGDFAPAASSKKVLFGIAGALVGAALPVGLLMLMGLMDTRFRYSDDAAGQSMAGIPLLGILPNLPDRLSDPAQASIAAHCVHQIRTMLQLNSMRDGSTAFAITSASSGDGKTSLSLALGLSFAASGSRTLLIDADLVGGGLTSRLGNEGSVGIVDALSGVGLEECVQPTDVADLSLLPIGSAQAHHAGSFSPPAVRKLLAEIRKHYEVIVIDTGPVMGSIEATPVCASVDGVVLTVARGQSRPLVERAITHLQSIGARISGVVFNRAQHKDFEQSIGAISVRSAARSTMKGTGHNGRKNGDMGAVAAAVAGSVRNEN